MNEYLKYLQNKQAPKQTDIVSYPNSEASVAMSQTREELDPEDALSFTSSSEEEFNSGEVFFD